MKISQVARLFGVSCDALRAWEQRGLFQAARTPGGQRVFGEAEIQAIATLLNVTVRSVVRRRPRRATVSAVQQLRHAGVLLARRTDAP